MSRPGTTNLIDGSRTGMSRRTWHAMATGVLTLLVGVLFVAPARADFGFVPRSVFAEAFDATGAPETQAGAHRLREGRR